jgi:hypothetical protein
MRMKRSVVRAAVMALTCALASCTIFAAAPSYPVLHQSAGNGEVDAPPGHLDRIPDISGNDNHFWSMDEPPTLDTSLGHTEINEGPTPPYTMNFNGGTSTMAPLVDLQRGQFYWAADIQITPNAQGAEQGGTDQVLVAVIIEIGEQHTAGGRHPVDPGRRRDVRHSAIHHYTLRVQLTSINGYQRLDFSTQKKSTGSADPVLLQWTIQSDLLI